MKHLEEEGSKKARTEGSSKSGEQAPCRSSYATLGTRTPLGQVASLDTLHPSESPAKRHIGLRRRMSSGENSGPAPRPLGGGHVKILQIPSLSWAQHK
nr:hypothetical protein Iba_chr01aCG5850 [Ipomoea batatas]